MGNTCTVYICGFDRCIDRSVFGVEVWEEMRHGSLFSGIGGFDLAAEWAGWENVFHCEWNTFGQKVLKHYWPNAISYEDITKTDFTIHRGAIDILTGGFPCQPYSQAGKRLGKEDDRHLWPEMLRAIREIQPTWVVGENVRGLTNWNGGLVFDEVQADLEAQGYEVTPFLLPACAVNAPHRRDRVWFVAYSVDNRYQTGRKQVTKENGIQGVDRQEMGSWEFDGTSFSPTTPNTHSIRRERRQKLIKAKKRGSPFKEQLEGYNRVSSRQWENFPTQSPVCDGNDGFSTGLDGITFPKWRNESIKAGGNAIVPQVAYQIFKAINEHNALRGFFY
jgi:DNA (cytosine-5)-methyltransferase 1